MTSLAKQLQQLAIPGQPSLRQVVSKKRPSLLFGAREAADIDVATIHALGCNGLEELIRIDAGFAAFEAPLFHESCQSFERTVQTSEALAELDETLGAFLRRLSPYFLLRPAQKCLEWLLRAFRVASFNVDAVMDCILPYHETKLFARVLQLLPLKAHSSRWHWLRPSQKAGSPLSRLTLVQHCTHTPSFLAHLCEMVPRCIAAKLSPAPSALRGVLALYLSTVLGVLQQQRVSEELLTLLLPHLIRGLKSELLDYQAATYVIIGQLVTVATLEERLNTSLLEAMSKHPQSSLEAVACMAVLVQTQRLASLSRKTVKHLLKLPSLVSELAKLSGSCNVNTMLRPLLAALVARELHGNATPLQELLDEVSLDAPTALSLAREVLCQFKSVCGEEGGGEKALTPASHIVLSLDTKYPSAMDEAIQEGSVGGGEEEGGGRWLQQLLSHSLPSSRHQLLQHSGSTSLALGIHHVNAAIREAAVRQLGQALSEGLSSIAAESGFADASLLARLVDDEPSVVVAVLEIEPQLLFASCDADTLTGVLLSLLSKPHLHRPSSPWQQCALRAVEALTSQGLLDHAPLMANDVIVAVIPLLFVRRHGNEFAWKVADVLAASAMATTHPLLIGLSDVLLLPVWRCVRGEGVSADGAALSEASVVVLTHIGRQLGALSHDTAVAMFKLLPPALKGATQKHTHVSLATVAAVAIETAPLLLQLRFIHSIFGYVLESADDMISSSVKVPLCLDRASDVFLSVIAKHPQRSLSQALLLLWILKRVAVNLQVPSELSTSMWLRVPEACSSNLEEQYHSALLKLLFLFTSCIDTAAMETGVPSACKELLQHLLQTHLRGRGVLLRFLAMVWTAPGRDDITPALQARCLSIAAAYVSSLDGASAVMLTGPHCPVVPSLLPPLSSPHEAVRQNAVKCLTALHRQCSTETPPTSPAPLHRLVAALSNSHLELLADATTLPRLLGTMMSYSATPLPPGRRKRKRSGVPDPQALLECLVTHAMATDMPTHTQCSLLDTLADVQHKAKLAAVVPVIHSFLEAPPPSTGEEQGRLLSLMIRCYGDSTAQFLDTETEGFQLLIRLLGATRSPSKTTPTPQEMAIQQITPEFFAGLPVATQRLLLRQLIDRTLDASSSTTLLKSCIRKLPLTAELMASELSRHDDQTAVAMATPSKRLRRSKVASALTSWTEEEGMPLPWIRVMLTLELTQQCVEADHAPLLGPALFGLLERCLGLPPHCRQQLEYTQQLLLFQLLSLTTPTSGRGCDFDVELVVQCIRSSSNPQTHRHALLLLSAAAAVYPDRVLHNIMPVFTFMGSHMLRHDDQYSFHVIAKTIDSVIPALMKSDAAVLATPSSRGKRSVRTNSSVVSVVTEIIRVFVDAGPHVPEHRRLPLFSRLLATVGVGKYLHVAMAMIIEQQITEESVKDESLQSVPCLGSRFLEALFHSFPVLTQLDAVLAIARFLHLLPLGKPTSGVELRKVSAEVSALFNVAAHSERQLQQFTLTSFTLLHSLLSHHTLTTEAQGVGGDDLIAMETTILSTLQLLLGHAAALRQKDGSTSAKFVELLSRKVYKALSQVVALMSPASFVEVVTQLIGQSSHVTGHVTGEAQRKAIEMLSAKLESKSSFTEENDPGLLHLLEVLVGVVKDDHAPQSTRRSALHAIELLTNHFTGRHEPHLVQVLEEVVAMATEGVEPLVLSGCLLCVSALCRVLGPHTIPLLPSLLPLTLSHITHNSSDQLLLAATTTLTVVVETLPKFLSAYAAEMVTRTCGLGLVGVAEGSPLYKQAIRLRGKVAEGLQARVLLPALLQSYPAVEQQGKSCVLALLGVLETAVAGLTAAEVKGHVSSLLALFTALLDYRATHTHGPAVAAVEGRCVEVFCSSVVVRLSEAAFRPIFLKLLDWATGSSAPRLRSITFFHLANCVAGKLKALFLLFAGDILKSAAQLLDQNHSEKYESPFLAEAGDACELLSHILQCLRQCFRDDHKAFLSRERFHSLLPPLVDQVSNQCGGEEESSVRVQRDLAPCVAAFALAAGGSHWKALNQRLLLTTRHHTSQVRLAGVRVLREVCGRLGEEFMVLLPETLPFLAELMEDENEEVERSASELIRSLEASLGEDIQQYF